VKNIQDYKPTERFSSRVQNYVKYRPGYPNGIIDVLRKNYSLAENSVIADIGSGTGIFSKLLLQNYYQVKAVEPNPEMRTCAEQYLSEFNKYQSFPASVEKTTLPDRSVDAITAAQAFHWFDIEAAKKEFYRILKTNGIIALIWNERKVKNDPFHQQYETALLKYCPEYKTINHANFTRGKIESIFSRMMLDEYHFANEQILDLPSLIGRLESSSYCPTKDDPNYVQLMNTVKKLFDGCNKNGQIIIDYDCIMYCLG